jgi:hypothetical protein
MNKKMMEEQNETKYEGKPCCSKPSVPIDLKEHWNNKYLNSIEEKLGWYETDLSPSMNLIFKTNLDKNARILIA